MLSALLILSLRLTAGNFAQVYNQDVPKVEVWSFEDFTRYTMESSEKLKVINFWATWCAPCIKELPLFESIHSTSADDVEVLLVSVDFADLLDDKVVPFVEKKALKSKTVLLADENYNTWIDKVDPSWSGALPATLFILHDGTRIFKEKQFEGEELSKLVDELVHQNQ